MRHIIRNIVEILPSKISYTWRPKVPGISFFKVGYLSQKVYTASNAEN